MQTLMIVSTTVEQKTDAEKLLKFLFEERLIGCAQISGPVQSYYRWEGEMENSAEYILSVKTMDYHLTKVVNTISQNHPYDVPEITAKKLDYVNEPYSSWLEGEVI